MVSAPTRHDLEGLWAFALGQGGYFDRRDALSFGVSDHTLQHHAAAGRVERVFPGVYRLRIAPISPVDDYLQAWVWTNYRGAISHESALALYDLADMLPTKVHVTVPRPFHRTSAPFQVHLGPLPEHEVQQYSGVRVTAPARSIVDAAAWGGDPTQIVKAVHEAMARGITTAAALRSASTRRPNQYRHNVHQLIEQALTDANA
jgi:predicted transcriptional regulator of viral defense system